MPGEAVEAGAAQQVEQHGLGLVVGGVAGEHVGRQRRVAGRARPGFEVRARARPGRAPTGTQHRTSRADRGHDVGVRARAGPQPVVDMDRRDLTAGVDREDQQGQRVGAARDGAQVTGGCPVDGNGAAGERGQATATRSRPIQRSGSRISASDGRFSGPSHARSSSAVPPARSTAAMNSLALLVLVELRLEADQPLHQLAAGLTCRRRSRSTRPKRAALGMRPCRRAVHGHVAVALEQAHQPADLVEHARCSGVASSATSPPSSSGF